MVLQREEQQNTANKVSGKIESRNPNGGAIVDANAPPSRRRVFSKHHKGEERGLVLTNLSAVIASSAQSNL